MPGKLWKGALLTLVAAPLLILNATDGDARREDSGVPARSGPGTTAGAERNEPPRIPGFDLRDESYFHIDTMVVPDGSDGAVRRRILFESMTTRYEEVHVRLPDGRRRALLRDRVRLRWASDVDGKSGERRIECWPLDSARTAPLWVLDGRGEEGGVVTRGADALCYRTVAHGCCGDPDDEVLYDLRDGSEIARSSRPIAWIAGPRRTPRGWSGEWERRVVTCDQFGGWRDASGVEYEVACVAYGARPEAQRCRLIAPRLGARYWPHDVAVRLRGAPRDTLDLVLEPPGDSDRGPDAGYAGIEIVVTLKGEISVSGRANVLTGVPPLTWVIPIEGDRLRPDLGVVPEGLRAEASP